MTRTNVRSIIAFLSAIAVAIMAFVVWGTNAYAFGGTDITVRVSNSAEVSNSLSVEANTGHNNARGGDGDDGGDGGNATGRNATGGNGGNGGSGGSGGSVMTGNATAIGTIDNDINNNRVFVEGCGCDNSSYLFFRGPHRGGNDTSVTASNRASVINALAVNAMTGGNSASAGDGDDGGDGGDARDASQRSWHRWFNWWQGSGSATGGNGGTGGSGGEGGTVETGDSVADGLIVNVINRNVTRVMGGNNDDNDELPI